MNKIWFTSDTHAFHPNISGPKVSSWTSGYRTFEDEVEMSQHIIKVFNETVGEDDTLYHLGDWSFGGIQNIWNFRKQLKCKNIHLCLGNHDHHIQKNKVLPNVLFNSSRGIVDWPGHSDWDESVKAKSIFSSTQSVIEELKIGKNSFFLSHYPHLSWLGSSKGHIHLHGHEHGNIDYLNTNCRRMDVGIDSAYKIFGEYRPFSLEEVLEINLKKPISELGHHTKNTNIR